MFGVLIQNNLGKSKYFFSTPLLSTSPPAFWQPLITVGEILISIFSFLHISTPLTC